MKYSKKTGCFYPSDVGYTDLPSDLVNVNAGEFERAMARGAGETFEVVDGRVVIVPVKPSEFHTWDTKSNKWILSQTKAVELKAAELAAAKSAKLSEIATAAQALIDTIVFDSAPAFERETYALQAAEALAWSRDKSAKTPVLDGIAAARGVPLELLKVKALEKSQQYQALCGAVAGQRQAFEDQVNAAADAAGVALIVPTYRVA